MILRNRNDINKVFEKYNIIKEIDFEKDIDTSKSDLYSCNDGQLMFLAGKKKNVDFGWHRLHSSEVLTGEVALDNMDNFRRINGTMFKSEMIISKYALKCDEILEADLSKMKEIEDNFHVFELHYLTDLWIEYYNNLEKKDDVYLLSPFGKHDSEYTCIQILNKSKYLVDYKNADIHGFTNLKSADQFFLSTNALICDNKIYGYNKNNQQYFMINYQNPKEENMDVIFDLDRIKVRDKSGYIYLKPIKIDNLRDYKFVIVANRNLECQVYDVKSDKWKVYDYGFVVIDSELNFRIKMDSSDRIHRIFLALKDERGS